MYHARLEPTLSDLQAQIDELSIAVARERESPGSPEALDQLAELAERCREILKRWTEMDHRHADAIGEVEARLSEWNAIEGRLERESADRLRALEQSIARAGKTLRDIHEVPAQQLRDQANTLSQTSMAAANLSLQAFERSETRLAALEADIHARLAQLSVDVQTAISEMRRAGGAGPAALPAKVAPFPLDGIMRIHEEHREGAVEEPAGPAPTPPQTFDVPPLAVDGGHRALPEAASAWTDRLETLEREVLGERDEMREAAARTNTLRREGLITAAIVIALVGVTGFVTWRMEQDVTTRLDDASARAIAAEHQAQAASETATREVASVRADASREIADAREAARRAELTGVLLVAPDLVRLNLDGTDETGHATGQALFSRTTGLVVNASHVAAPPAGTTYQVWLQSGVGAVSVGFLIPDGAGRAVLAIEPMPDAPRPITGLLVTTEPTGGRPAPSGPVLLARAPPQ